MVHGDHELSAYLPGMRAEMRRNDPWMVVEAGRALSRYDARPWASSLGMPAAVMVTTQDRLVRPRKQRALAQAVGARGRLVEVDGDHLVPWEHPERFAVGTVDAVRALVQALEPSAP